MFGVGSVVFSLLSLLSQIIPLESDKHIWLNSTIPFLSIVMVIIALYLSPTSRVIQYIEAWKKLYDRLIACVARRCLYKTWSTKLQDAIRKNIPRDGIQDLIDLEAMEITEVISECERMLTTDGE